MPRKKGPGTKKFLDATKQDDVEMRRALWLGGALPELQAKLADLYTTQSKLLQLRSDLAVRAADWLDKIKNRGEITLVRAKEERKARSELRNVQLKLQSAESELRRTNEQIDETKKEIEQARRSQQQREAAFPWQEKAVQIIMFHKFARTTGDCVLSTQDATITTDELQMALLDEGFKVGARELRRFMRKQCGVEGRQGKRTDLTSPSKPQLASLSSAVPEKPESNRELIEQRRAEQAALTPTQRAARVHKRDAASKAYEHYCDSPEGRAEQDHKKRLTSFYAKHPKYKDSQSQYSGQK